MPRKRLASQQRVDNLLEADSSTAPRLGALQNRGKTKEIHKSHEHVSSMPFEPHRLHWLYRETLSRLERYERAVAAQSKVDAAVEFARYVRMSGLVDFFKSCPQGEPFVVDGKKIQTVAANLEMACCDLWRKGEVKETRDTQLEDIGHKLDLIAGRLAKIPIADSLGEVVPMPSAQRG